MFTIQNTVTDHVWNTDSRTEALIYIGLSEYNIYRMDLAPRPLMRYEI